MAMVERVRSSKQLPIMAETKPSNGHGGRRTGAGGGPKRIEIRSLKNEVLYLRTRYNKMPLNHLLDILNAEPPAPPTPPDAPPREPANTASQRVWSEYREIMEEYTPILDEYEKKLREHRLEVKAFQQRQDWAAVQAAPFMHHRLSAIEISGPDGAPLSTQKMNLRKLNEAELDMLETLVRKASVVTLDEDQYHEVD